MPLMGFASPLGGGGGAPSVVVGPSLALVQFASTGAPDFGSDILVFPDLDDSMEPSSGAVVLLDAIGRRLMTPEQRLADYEDYGIDLRVYVNAVMDGTKLGQLRHAVETEAEQDERVLSCTCTATFNPDTQRVKLSIGLETAQGPFTLTLAVTNVTVELLSEP